MAIDPPRRLRASCRWFVAVIALTGLSAPQAGSEELIRYKRADGSVGFAGSQSSVPPGAIILTRKPTSEAPDDTGVHAPAIDRLVSSVRRHCESRYREGRDDFDYCITDQTRAAFLFRDLMLEQRRGTEAFRLIEGCRRRFERGRVPDYRELLACTETELANFEDRTGQHPAELDSERNTDAAERKRRAAQHRLRQLRENQAASDRELAIGRNRWRPRYHKAEREFHAAEAKTQGILEQMRRHGCRRNTLACGDLGPRLERAQRDEDKKRRFLEIGIVEECRLAGCQPGWLR